MAAKSLHCSRPGGFPGLLASSQLQCLTPRSHSLTYSYQATGPTPRVAAGRRPQQAAFDALADGHEVWGRHPLSGLARTSAETLVGGTKANQAKVDQVIEEYTENWELERMAVVDRNILRAGVYEMLWTAEVPAKVAINEAIEIAKKFGTKESSRFINGVLDRIHKELRPTS